MAYTIQIIGLECVTSEEIDGDETYLTLNQRKIWEAHPDKMSHAAHGSVSQFDFLEGRKLSQTGWVSIANFQPSSLVFKRLSGETALQLWDADTLSPDDLLGETPVDESQASGGNISVVFQRRGAHYRLTYKVEA